MRALGSRSEVVVVKLHVAGAVEGVVLVHVVLVRRVVQLLVRVIVNVMLVACLMYVSVCCGDLLPASANT